MTKFLLILLFVAVCSAQRRPGRNSTRIAPASVRPNPFNVNYDTWCEDNGVPAGRWFVYPPNCEYALICWDNEDGLGVVTEFDTCNVDRSEWFFRVGWAGDVVCDTPAPGEFCLEKPLTWPLCPPGDSQELVFHPAENCDSYYICVGGFPIQIQCAPPLHWSADRDRCELPDQAGCEENWAPSPPTLPDCRIEYGQIFLPHPTDCELFIACNFGNRSVGRCPHLHHFDVVTERCMSITRNPTCILDFSSPR